MGKNPSFYWVSHSLCSSKSQYLGRRNSFELPWDWRMCTGNIMPEKEKLEVPERICYTPTSKTERPPISENLTPVTPCAAANNNILEHNQRGFFF